MQINGKGYTVTSGKTNKHIIDFQGEGYQIFLSSRKNEGCGTPDENFHIIIRTPRRVGKYPEYYAFLSDPGTSDYSLFAVGNIIKAIWMKQSNLVTYESTLKVPLNRPA